ncbi:class I SAM-dependent DNA methyltransferase [Evansella halocellulosilytica]|uniref:class I SAM-dependent DNA methyltransferase n=1 Tax=Evansella halocellulosilytica TaxID=2011013 RepID=UPI000BB6EAC4|nr:class I SAM-dependent methyltransferase [Evansella halocellulosilytica]
MSYEQFSSLYDNLMEDAPYERWVNYTEKHLPIGSSILDVGCGTGTFTSMLYEAGYHMAGIDLSSDMLAIAERKARDKNQQILFACQDMREISGFENLDGVTLFCDGLNYLTTAADVQQTFKRIYNSLKFGGTFLFDVHSIYKIEEIFSNHLFGENREDLSYMWFCSPGEAEYSVEHTLTFFVKGDNGAYTRFDEEHKQRTFPINMYVSWLEQSGFSSIEITGEFGTTDVRDEDDRIFFKAIKK